MVDILRDVELVLSLPPEELALHVLDYLRLAEENNRGQLNRYNFTLPNMFSEHAGPRTEEVTKAFTEAWVWLEREGILAPRPGTTDRDWVYITRKGRELKTLADLAAYRHAKLLQEHHLDPELARKVLPLFRPDDYLRPCSSHSGK